MVRGRRPRRPACCEQSGQRAGPEGPARTRVSLKVSEKGGLSVYGLGRLPVTLYREQWEKLLEIADEIRNFIRENDQTLKKKE
jgi:hypothetical protein